MLDRLNTYIGVWKVLIVLLTVKASCSNIVNRHGLDGSIESTGFPENYPHNSNITWRAYGPLDAISLSVTIVKFDIFKDSECHDFLQITQVYDNSVVFRKCGTLPETNFIILGNKMLVTFVSDGKNTAPGFKLRWKVRDYKKGNTDPIVVIHVDRCLQTPSTTGSLVSIDSKYETASENLTEPRETKYCQTPPFGYHALLKDFIIGVLSIALVGVSTILCVQCKRRTMEKKSDSYDAISSLLSDIDLPLQENMDVLLRAISVSTRSAVPEDPIYDNVANECDYENAESFRKSQSYIDVDELEQKAMYLNYDQMQTPPSENFKNILNSHQKKIGSKKSSTLHSYIDVIGELAEAGAFHSDSMTSSGYSKPSQDVLMQLKEVLKIPKKKSVTQ